MIVERPGLNRGRIAIKIAREDLTEQMESNGFRLAKEHTFLPYQHFLVFVPK